MPDSDDRRYATMADVARLEDRIDRIDNTGSRGVSVLALQIQQLSQDFAKHEKLHETEQLNRIRNRRWIIGTIIGVVAAIDGPVLTLVLLIVQKHP
jgi:hypothetical protein